jgi:hypothetical protein
VKKQRQKRAKAIKIKIKIKAPGLEAKKKTTFKRGQKLKSKSNSIFNRDSLQPFSQSVIGFSSLPSFTQFF